MVDHAGFWDGSGGAIIGSISSTLIALGTILWTRRNDRRLLREQRALDAAARILNEAVSLGTVLEYRIKPDGDDFGEWLSRYLEVVHRFQRRLIPNLAQLDDESLRDDLVLITDTLANSFVDMITLTEAGAARSGRPLGDAVNAAKGPAHDDLMQVVRALNNWLATGRRDRPALSAAKRAELRRRSQQPTRWRQVADGRPSDQGDGDRH